MKAIILCGGKGQRIQSQINMLPKALFEVNKKPLIHYVIERFVNAGITDFVLCGGFLVDELFRHFEFLGELKENREQYRTFFVEFNGVSCRVRVYALGESLNKMQRLRKVILDIDDEDKTFLISYCDCICDVDVKSLLEQHRLGEKLFTVMAVQPISRYGHLECDGDKVLSLQEKPKLVNTWINGGFFVVSTSAIPYFCNEDNSVDFETGFLPKIAKMGELCAYKHFGFWKSVESIKDIEELENK